MSSALARLVLARADFSQQRVIIQSTSVIVKSHSKEVEEILKGLSYNGIVDS